VVKHGLWGKSESKIRVSRNEIPPTVEICTRQDPVSNKEIRASYAGFKNQYEINRSGYKL
jgi:hypothetical protein